MLLKHATAGAKATADTNAQAPSLQRLQRPRMTPWRALPQMREEQRAVVAQHGPALTRAAVADMVWADAMAREVLRLRGPAEGLFRCARPELIGVPWILKYSIPGLFHMFRGWEPHKYGSVPECVEKNWHACQGGRALAGERCFSGHILFKVMELCSRP